MRIREIASLLALAAVSAACSAETSQESPVVEPVQETEPTAGETPSTGPAGEVAAGTREPRDAPGAPKLPAGVDADWAPYYAHIDFVFGSEAGLARAAESGKPMMMYYAATW